MPYKDKNSPEAKLSLKTARDKWYKNNKNRQIDLQLKRRKNIRQWLWRYKRSLKCFDCKISFKDHPEWCDFHHLNPLLKEGTIRNTLTYSKKKMLLEINKCVPLCANCHRTRHVDVAQG